MFGQNSIKNRLEISEEISSEAFPLATISKVAPILFDTNDAKVVSIAANAFAADVNRITGIECETITTSGIKKRKGNYVVIGTLGESGLIEQFEELKLINASEIQGKWESYLIAVIENPFDKKAKILVVAGSDRRGTAYGVFELSKLIGVSPWYWWADVSSDKKANLFVHANSYVHGPPDVKFRGIFLNDEDWGLQPWAGLNLDKDINDIGPKTYAKIFELLLRLKANFIWPAMHHCTKAFFSYPENKNVANDYAIVLGSSHAEPMLRNNVDEWNEKTMGSFSYSTNKDAVYSYWEKRVEESRKIDAVYTVGMRGVHDSGMKGVKNNKEAATLLEKIIADQRFLLQKYVADDVTKIPQAFTAYKEVLDIYDEGLKLPDDITIVWPDDNYGYIHRLSNTQEQNRTGGSGVYYHVSYWGRPHDYLWLSSTNPALIREEMMKAFNTNSNQIWVLNVGDIKPLEYNIELFMNMAYDASPFQDAAYVKKHHANWYSTIFGSENAETINQILWDYYTLAFERRPEFMGWSQTERNTPVYPTQYNHFFFGDEAQKRLEKYDFLEKQVKELYAKTENENKDAFYQLVYYPVVGASLMSKKYLYRDKSIFYATQNRISANDYAILSKEAYDEIIKETSYFNTELVNGKWNGMMSYKPRNLPVFLEPEFPDSVISSSSIWSISPEGMNTDDSLEIATEKFSLPEFNICNGQEFFVDVFLTNSQSIQWKAETSDNWIKLSEQEGELTGDFGEKENRIWVSIDWDQVPEQKKLNGYIEFKAAGKTLHLNVNVNSILSPSLKAFEGFVEENGIISIYAENYCRKANVDTIGWTLLEDLGHTGNSLVSLPLNYPPLIDSLIDQSQLASVEYNFYTSRETNPRISVFTLPTHELSSQYKLRYAISIDDEPFTIIDFRTFGRTSEWKLNVLSNKAVRTICFKNLSEGKHTLKIYMIDPGVILDFIEINLGGNEKAYSIVPETKKVSSK